MLFIYLVASVLAALLSYGCVLLFGMGNHDSGLAFFLLLVVGMGSLVGSGFLLYFAKEELVYWDFHTDTRDWCYDLVLKRLPEDAVAWDWRGWYEYNPGWYDHSDVFHAWFSKEVA